MKQVTRVALYFVPDGNWGDAGASWLGWDIRTGTALTPVGDAMTKRPRKYGFHATLKAPFVLDAKCSMQELQSGVEQLCATLSPCTLDSLELSTIGRFLALTAPQQHSRLRMIADPIVTELDTFRAPLSEADLIRRRKQKLSPRQDELLQLWGYPHVLDAFKFHMTLTGPVDDPDKARRAIIAHFGDLLHAPLQVSSVSIVGEREDGQFEELTRVALSG